MRRLVVTVAVVFLVTRGSALAVSRKMFVTSETGFGNLLAWAHSGATTDPLVAGDNICQYWAAQVPLDNPGSYRVWLSTSTTDAYCHVLGFDGTKGLNCNQGSPLPTAGPWRRTDNSHFAAELNHMLMPFMLVYRPPRLDESQVDVSGGIFTSVFTGTSGTGEATEDTCDDWTSFSTSGTIGSVNATGAAWTDAGPTRCDLARHLYCFESGTADPLPLPSNWGRLAFVTSKSGSADFASWPESGGDDGLVGANTICRTLAAAAGLQGASSFKPWLSNESTDAVDRFDNDGPWMRIDRIPIADNLAGLTDGKLKAPLNVTETGKFLDIAAVWTGSDSAGHHAGSSDCDNWSSTSVFLSGMIGLVPVADSSWTEFFSDNYCFDAGHLYCLLDLPQLFNDDFECSSTDAWSTVMP
jgi:hypothetical protein